MREETGGRGYGKKKKRDKKGRRNTEQNKKTDRNTNAIKLAARWR